MTQDTPGQRATRADVGHFNEAAATWDENPARRQLTEAIARALRSTIVLHPQWRVLEYGCGTAALSLLLAPHVREIVAADASPGMVDQVRRKLETFPGVRVRPHLLDLTATAGPTEQYDLVLMAMALHHIEDVPALLARLSAMLAPDGWLAIADLAAEDGSFHAPMVVPHNGFTAEVLASQIAGALGGPPVQVQTVHTVSKNDRSFPVQLWVARKQ